MFRRASQPPKAPNSLQPTQDVIAEAHANASDESGRDDGSKRRLSKKNEKLAGHPPLEKRLWQGNRKGLLKGKPLRDVWDTAINEKDQRVLRGLLMVVDEHDLEKELNTPLASTWMQGAVMANAP